MHKLIYIPFLTYCSTKKKKKYIDPGKSVQIKFSSGHYETGSYLDNIY